MFVEEANKFMYSNQTSNILQKINNSNQQSSPCAAQFPSSLNIANQLSSLNILVDTSPLTPEFFEILQGLVMKLKNLIPTESNFLEVIHGKIFKLSIQINNCLRGIEIISNHQSYQSNRTNQIENHDFQEINENSLIIQQNRSLIHEYYTWVKYI